MTLSTLSLSFALLACGERTTEDTYEDTETVETSEDTANTENDTEENDDTEEESEEEEERVAFEILQILSADEMIVWVNMGMTEDDFEAIDSPSNWFKNQPREGEPDASSFARSPNAEVDGEFTYEEHFGHNWLHNATVIEANTPIDEAGLLRRHQVEKFHSVTFFAERTLTILISPEEEQYVRISRDANRTEETHALPDGWSLTEYIIPEELTFTLPNPTINIRAENEDSYQGPISPLPLD